MKRKKLLYVPGLISIIGLPILLYFFGPEDHFLPVGMKLYLPSEKNDSNGIRFSKEYVYGELKGKEIITINLDEERGDQYDEKTAFLFYKKILFISHEVEKIQFTNDTSTVLKVELGRYNTYADFVWVINQAYAYKVKRFAWVDNDIYFFANPPATHDPVIELSIDNSGYIPEEYRYTPPSKWVILKERLEEVFKELIFYIRQNYIYSIAFLILVILPGIIAISRRRFS